MRNIIGCIAIVVVYYSPVVDGIRSSTSLSSLQSSDRTTRTFLLNTRGGFIANRDGDAYVSVVPEATLPQAISGMSTRPFLELSRHTLSRSQHNAAAASFSSPNNVPATDFLPYTPMTRNPVKHNAAATILSFKKCFSRG
jgi:hypothetical protein